jgi:hypothetical protein
MTLRCSACKAPLPASRLREVEANVDATPLAELFLNRSGTFRDRVYASACDALIAAGYVTVGDVSRAADVTLLQVKHVGPSTVQVIREALAEAHEDALEDEHIEIVS